MEKSMKFFRFMLIAVLIAGVIMTADAQRRGGFGRSYRVSGGSYARAYGYRPPVVIRSYPSIHYAPHYYAPSYYAPSYYAPRYYGPRYYGVPRGSISISFGGNPYFYSGGIFYQPYGGYYRSIFPPIGIHVGVLPVGYTPIYVGPDLYYFYNGIYYRNYNDREYEVVDAPMGAQLSSLPSGAKSVVVNGEKFYELSGTYYREDRNEKGRRVYTVVGKNGRINNTDEAPLQQSQPAQPFQPGQPSAQPQADLPVVPRVGDRVADLPANCRSITLNGQKVYISPDDTYFQKETDGSYTIIGVPDNKQNVL